MRTPLLSLLFLVVSAPMHAQDAMPPTATAMRVTASPVVDGRLNEPAWETAKPITEFRQQEPMEGELSTEPTDVRIVYDDTQLYIGVSVTDSAPAQIRASELRRDNTLEADDNSRSFSTRTTTTGTRSCSESIRVARVSTR